MEELRLLTARAEGGTIHAALPLSRVMGRACRDGLEHDCRLLAETGAVAVRLDLRAVAFIDGAFFGVLVGLARDLRRAGGRLTVEASADLADVLRVTRLDRLIEVVGGPGGAG